MSLVIDPNNVTSNVKQVMEAAFEKQDEELTNQIQNNTNYQGALQTLQNSLTTFQTALADANESDSLLRYATTVSDNKYGSASAGSHAQPGTYAFKVRELATAGMSIISGLSASGTTASGSFTIMFGSSKTPPMTIDLSNADTDKDGKVTPAEIARAINSSPANGGKISASIITAPDGTQQLCVASRDTGKENDFTIDASNVADPNLQTALTNSQHQEATDAQFSLTGIGKDIEYTQASNAFSGIDGLSVTFNATTGDTPFTVAVAADAKATANQLQKLVDAYNKLQSVLAAGTSPGSKNDAAGYFAADPAVRGLMSSLTSILQGGSAGHHLFECGLQIDKRGQLTFDSSKCNDAVSKNPGLIDTLFKDAGSGLFAKFKTLMGSWLNDNNGLLKNRLDNADSLAKQLQQNQQDLTAKEDQARVRYTKQFQNLQNAAYLANLNKNLLKSLLDTNSK